jgi:RNA polymerase sigma-70 factor (ECF subfamily)
MPARSSDDLPSDGQLALSVMAGAPAPDAERELCARFAPRVRSYGLRHLKDASEADDLVQRVLLLVLTKLRAGEVREPDRIASFVLGSARVTARSMHRDRGRGDVLGDHPLPEIAVEPREPIDRLRLVSCLQALGERERLVIVHSFFDGATAPQIAESLGIESGHVRVVRHRALTRLRTCLSDPAEGAT